LGHKWKSQEERAVSFPMQLSRVKLKAKKANIAGLQLADLLAYPSKQGILVGEERIDELGSFDITFCHN
jgi:hypothetical protein